MKGKRCERVGELIRMELGAVILNRLRDPRLGFVTVTHVEVSNDLQHAKVFYSVMGDEKKKDKTREALEHARGFLQKDIAEKINMRYTPQLHFFLDDSIDKQMEIDGILRKIHPAGDLPAVPDQEEKS